VRALTHGSIACGTVVTPDLAASLADYQRVLKLDVLEDGQVPAALAASWGCPASAGRRMVLLGSANPAGNLIRLVEGSAVPDYVPLRSYGWASLELTVADVWALHETIVADGAFRVIGAPKLVEGFDNFIPMQVIGRAGEVLYLNKVLKSMSSLDLPEAHAWVDRIFIAILAAQNRKETVDFHVAQLGFEEDATYEITYSVINNAFGLPDSYKTAMTMTKAGRLPASEVDQYPAETIVRPCASGELPPGVALMTFAVRDLDMCRAHWITPPVARDGPLYQGRRCCTVRGASGELIELIESRS
jgi:catechol 2,3-dioxygenase-like lactoylglutathione lyase family enzyme